MEFKKKVENLIGDSQNQFVKTGLKVSSVTTSKNGAVKYDTTGNPFVDNFAAISYFKEPRSYEEVAKDMSILWSVDPKTCLKLAVYMRIVTRKSVINTPDSQQILDTQIGAGLKNEGIMRMLWLAINQRKTFEANIYQFIAAGSWKDIFQMLSLDLQYHGWKDKKLRWTFFRNIIKAGLLNDNTTHLVRKYLPTIRTNKRCTTLEAQADTLVGRWFANQLFPKMEKSDAYKQYRIIKANGVAHQWQQAISKQLYEEINFDTVAGRALSLLVGSKFLSNHGLIGKYQEWIKAKPTAKYTGFVFELFKGLGDIRTNHIEQYKEDTINAQFRELIEKGKKTSSNLLVVRDTSGSMFSKAVGCNMSSYGIAKAMALYFSEYLEGPFANCFAEFSDKCLLRKWEGNTPCEKWVNDHCSNFGSTNFQSVIDMLIEIKNIGVPESYFPSGLLLVSDGELNPADEENSNTNFCVALSRLMEAGFSKEYIDKFKLILWDIPNSYYGDNKVKFESWADAPNFFYISGYDPAAVSFILGESEFKDTPNTAEELFKAAMNQELLNTLKVIK